LDGGIAGVKEPDEIDRKEAFHRVAEILHCKWSIAVLDAIERGISRPAQMQREHPGLSGKVLNQRLRKLERFDLIERRAFAEVPPRVEYTLSEQGNRLVELIRAMRGFADQWATNTEDSAASKGSDSKSADTPARPTQRIVR
jgi:DNA-binding HxlR family transcriptional regulator